MRQPWHWDEGLNGETTKSRSLWRFRVSAVDAYEETDGLRAKLRLAVLNQEKVICNSAAAAAGFLIWTERCPKIWAVFLLFFFSPKMQRDGASKVGRAPRSRQFKCERRSALHNRDSWLRPRPLCSYKKGGTHRNQITGPLGNAWRRPAKHGAVIRGRLGTGGGRASAILFLSYFATALRPFINFGLKFQEAFFSPRHSRLFQPFVDSLSKT